MGTPSKIGNEYNVVINGTADWENTFVKFINFSAAGPSGTTTVILWSIRTPLQTIPQLK